MNAFRVGISVFVMGLAMSVPFTDDLLNNRCLGHVAGICTRDQPRDEIPLLSLTTDVKRFAEANTMNSIMFICH